MADRTTAARTRTSIVIVCRRTGKNAGALHFERTEGREPGKAYLTTVDKFGETNTVGMTRAEAARLREQLGQVIYELDRTGGE